MSKVNSSNIENLEPFSPLLNYDPLVEQERAILQSSLMAYLKAIYASKCTGGKTINDHDALVLATKASRELVALSLNQEIIGGVFKHEGYGAWNNPVRVGNGITKKNYKILINCEKGYEEAEFDGYIPTIYPKDSQEQVIYLAGIVYITNLEEEYGMGFTSTVIDEIRRLSEIKDNSNDFFVLEDEDVRRDDCD